MCKRLLFASALVGALMFVGFATPSTAEARHGHRGHHGHHDHHGGRSHISLYYGGGGYDPYYRSYYSGSYPAVYVPRSYYGYYGPSSYYDRGCYGGSNVSFSIGF
jgi:hypothetical protein